MSLIIRTCLLLSGCDVQGVNFTFTRDGRPSGEAYVELASESDVQQALNKNQQHMGKRYIEGIMYVLNTKHIYMETLNRVFILFSSTYFHLCSCVFLDELLN